MMIVDRNRNNNNIKYNRGEYLYIYTNKNSSSRILYYTSSILIILDISGVSFKLSY